MSDDIVLKYPPRIGRGYGEYYDHNFHCTNCHHTNHRYIKKGYRIDTMDPIECDNCGCEIEPK